MAAAESAYFALAFSRIGLVPDGGSSMFVAERVGLTRAAQLALLAEPLPARQAVDWGLINYAWPDEEFPGQVQALVQRLADGPTRSYAGIKRELNEWLLGKADGQLELEARTQQEMFTTSDAKEGITAFLEKRAPRFTGAKAPHIASMAITCESVGRPGPACSRPILPERAHGVGYLA